VHPAAAILHRRRLARRPARVWRSHKRPPSEPRAGSFSSTVCCDYFACQDRMNFGIHPLLIAFGNDSGVSEASGLEGHERSTGCVFDRKHQFEIYWGFHSSEALIGPSSRSGWTRATRTMSSTGSWCHLYFGVTLRARVSAFRSRRTQRGCFSHPIACCAMPRHFDAAARVAIVSRQPPSRRRFVAAILTRQNRKHRASCHRAIKFSAIALNTSPSSTPAFAQHSNGARSGMKVKLPPQSGRWRERVRITLATPGCGCDRALVFPR
jgi:hypothetical protein